MLIEDIKYAMSPMNGAVEELEELLLEEVTEEETGDTSELVVYNDDHNTFDWVIQCLIEILNHSYQQSEQLTLLVHFKGRAAVKTASLKVLKPLKDALIERGLSAVIETE